MSPSVHLQGSSIVNKVSLIEPQNPAEVPLPPQDETEKNALLQTEEWWLAACNNLPPEIALHILSYLLLAVKTHKMLDIAEYKKGEVLPEAWPALYKACSLPAKRECKRISQPDEMEQLQSFFHDAQKYGCKTLRQIIYGLDLRKKPLTTITIEDCMRAGIISRALFFPNDIPRSIDIQKHFLKWLCEKPERIIACLRWIPAQESTPYDLLVKTAKYKDISVFKAAFEYMTRYQLHDERNPYKGVLYEAVRNDNTALVQYLLDTDTQNQPDTNMLDRAAHNGYLPIVKLLLYKGVDLRKLDLFGKTVLESTIDSLSPYSLFRSSRNNEDYQETINQIDAIILLMRQYEDKGIPIEINRKFRYNNTFWHIACYARDSESSLWLANFLIRDDKYKKLINATNEYRYTPLQCAAKEQNRGMFQFLLNHGANIQLLSLTGTDQDVSRYGAEIMSIVRSHLPQNKASTKPVSPAISNALPPSNAQPHIVRPKTIPSPKVRTRLLSWVHTIQHLCARAFTILIAIPRTFFTLCRHVREYVVLKRWL